MGAREPSEGPSTGLGQDSRLLLLRLETLAHQTPVAPDAGPNPNKTPEHWVQFKTANGTRYHCRLVDEMRQLHLAVMQLEYGGQLEYRVIYGEMLRIVENEDDKGAKPRFVVQSQTLGRLSKTKKKPEFAEIEARTCEKIFHIVNGRFGAQKDQLK